MDNPTYKLSANLIGHLGDVRALAISTDGRIISASRDKTARVWKPSGNGRDYFESGVLTGHGNFVSSVCVLNPSTQNPKGLIITGSNDNTICVYKMDELEILQKIKAHQDTVCKLRTSISEEGTFFSSSWDKTTKVWKVKDLSKPHLTLTGHSAAVWCVADLTNGLIVTGSADKSVIVWSREGAILFKLSGHTDCVRDITSIKEDEFLTCANDATVRHWRASLGECLGSYSGHYNYIYSIAATPNGTYTYTCGEDRTLRVWHNGVIHQTINLPAQSIWCVDLLPNGDIVIGASDGIVRIFTANSERQADEEVIQEFEKQVAEVKLHAQLELGGMKIKDLPDAKALQEPGKTDGQTKMIRENDVVRAYSWSQSQHQWIRIGDVMGASGCSPATSGKQLYDGKEYDYVFSIDIQDGVPPLKLPYNVDQDPWHVAQKFLHDHELSQLFLDQVANFIVKNSQQSAPPSHTGSQYADPFTGGSRYIPSSGNSSINSTASAPNSISNTSVVSQSYIPHTKYLRLEQANFSTILEKIREFNMKQADVARVPAKNLELLAKLMENSTSESDRIIGVNVLNTLLNWPRDVVFPALDVARLAVLQKDVNEKLCTNDLLRIVKKHLEPNALVANQMLTYRMLANMFCHEQGEKLGLDSRDEVLKALLDLPTLGNKNNQVAISTYLLNLIISLNKTSDTSSRRTVLNVILALLPHLKESEAIFRTLVGMGTLLATSNAATRNQLIATVRQSEIAVNILKTMSDTDTNGSNPQNKLTSCSKEIIDLIL